MSNLIMTSKDLIIPVRLSRKIIYFIYIIYLPHSLFEKFINDSAVFFFLFFPEA